MKITSELREKSIPELEEKCKEIKKELLKLRTQSSGSANAENSGKIKKARKNIARVLTIIKEKETIKHD
jgi:ribosomal protein L29